MQSVQENSQCVRVVLSGAFCTGKTTLLKRLREDPELRIDTLFADATRAKRPGESECNPYKFISEEEYDRREQSGAYFYKVKFNGCRYATTHADAQKMRWAIDIVASNWPHFRPLEGTVSIYLQPPALPVLVARAKERGETDEAIQKRIKATLFDDPAANEFMYQVDSSETKEQVYDKVKRIVLKHMTQRIEAPPSPLNTKELRKEIL